MKLFYIITSILFSVMSGITLSALYLNLVSRGESDLPLGYLIYPIFLIGAFGIGFFLIKKIQDKNIMKIAGFISGSLFELYLVFEFLMKMQK